MLHGLVHATHGARETVDSMEVWPATGFTRDDVDARDGCWLHDCLLCSYTVTSDVLSLLTTYAVDTV